jgi:hypothetical protein
VNKVCVGTRVEPDLAQAVRRLADAGNRSLSREVAGAIRRHVIELLSEPQLAGAAAELPGCPTGLPGAGEQRQGRGR